MTIRLKGQLKSLVDKDGYATFELLPLSRKPEIGDDVLVKMKVNHVDKNGLIQLLSNDVCGNNRFKQSSIIVILSPTQPKEEEECLCFPQIPPAIDNNCPIHGKKVEEKMKWCEHTKNGFQYFFLTNVPYGKGEYTPLRQFNFCPICGAKRPDASIKVDLPEKIDMEIMEEESETYLSKEKILMINKINQLINYLKWKESHDLE